MTDDELIARLRDGNEVWGDELNLAADRIAALRERVAELEAEMSEQCRLHGAGSEREARLMAQVAELEGALEKIEALPTDYTVGPDDNMECARSIARKALGTPMPDLTALDPQASLASVLDEIARVYDLSLWIEQQTGHYPTDAELLRFQTVADVLDFVGEKV